MSIFSSHKSRMVTAEDALPGRSTPMRVPARHEVLGTPLQPPYPEGSEVAEFAMGCFWGAEKKFWQLPGVYSTQVGYAGGLTPNPRRGNLGPTARGPFGWTAAGMVSIFTAAAAKGCRTLLAA